MLIMLTLWQILAFACPKQALQGKLRATTGPPQGRAKTVWTPPSTRLANSSDTLIVGPCASDLHPRRIPEVNHETKNATRLR